MTGNHYRRVKPGDIPERVELIDNVTSQGVAVINEVNRRWAWTCSTTILLHGAPSADGLEPSLAQAKARVLDGLPS
ncbi:hypothetical protein NA78x_003469 [Anatilimnocola sp. NA78]|uniref:hypothetical protein n=1 Tax=Anatilimnocola sp. NA78 TaxID=3415683 RepID=UPI003CE4C525